MTGVFSGGTISNTGIFSARSAGTEQTYIELLRGALHDFSGTLYFIEDNSKFFFEDGQLYGALIRALNHISDAKSSRYRFSTFLECPWPSLLIDFGVLYALHQRSVTETINDISYNDEINFNIKRAPGFISALQVFKASLDQELKTVKLDYSFARTGFIGMGTTRCPMAISRIFSFIPQAAGLFSWGTSII